MTFKPKTEAAHQYALKLRDPRWKSRREEILRRDNHTCRGCGSHDPEPVEDDGYQEDIDPPEKVALEVHHKYYEWGNDPWDYPDSALITLCQMCHDTETVYQKDSTQRLIKAVQTRFLSKDIERLAFAIEHLAMPIKEHEKAARLIAWVITDRVAMETLENIHAMENTGLRPAGDLTEGFLQTLEDLHHG